MDITPQFVESYDDTNQLERLFAAELVTAVFAEGGVHNAGDLIEGLLDRVAPHGVKRMMHAILDNENPAFIGYQDVPRSRYVQDFDANRARLLIAESRGECGTFCGEHAHRWLKAAVKVLYDTLRDRLRRYDALSTLRQLLLRNEALVREDALRDLTFASILACAAREPSHRSELEEQIGRHAQAATATRFLIEHVVAEPPGGEAELSDSDFDEILAMAAEIIVLGTAADVQYYELARVAVDAGDLGYELDLGGYRAAVLAGRGQLYSERFEDEAARDRLPHRRRKLQEPPAEVVAMDAGVVAEFGCTLQDLAFIFGESSGSGAGTPSRAGGGAC